MRTSNIHRLGLVPIGVIADMCVKSFPLVSLSGASGVLCVRKHGSDDPHWRQLEIFIINHSAVKFSYRLVFHFSLYDICMVVLNLK